jgi:hypothetical protein
MPSSTSISTAGRTWTLLTLKDIHQHGAGHVIHSETEPVKLQVGPFIATIPAGSFMRGEEETYIFKGVIDSVQLKAKIELTGGFRYAFFHAEATGANLEGTTNPVQVSLGIGENAGLTLVEVHFDRDH